MKKLLILSICSLLLSPVFAQESSGGDSPGFRFGIKVNPNVSWFRPADKNVLEGDGAKVKIAFGLITEFRLAKNYSFATGIDFPSLSGGSLRYVVATDSINYTPSNDTVKFYIASRSYNLQYVEIPITLKLKTNEIGYMTYFGQIGAQLGIRTKARSVDEGKFAGSTSTTKLEDVDVNQELLFVKAALTIGGGVEYNLSGNTSLVGAVSYMYGITNALKKESKMLQTKTGEAFEQKANLDQVVLTIGILF